MLPIKDSIKFEEYTWTESKGMEKIFNQQEYKRQQGKLSLYRQNTVKKNSQKRQRWAIIIKGSIHQEDITFVNIHVFKFGASKQIK